MVAEAEHHKFERNCELKLDLDKSDHVGLVNKHHVQKPPPQQQLSVPDKTGRPFSSFLGFILLTLTGLVSFFVY